MERWNRAIIVVSLLFGLKPVLAAEPLKIGMSAAFSGPSAVLGTNMRYGIEAYFNQINAEGGVHGRPLELVAIDDGYEPEKTGPNMRRLIDQDKVYAVIGNVGTPTATVAVPIANEKHTPLFGAFTGAGLLRKTPPDRYVVNFRASYAEETAEMVRGFVAELGLKPEEIAFFTQNDAYGDAGFNGGMKALKAAGLQHPEHVAHGRYPRNTDDVEAGLSKLMDPKVHIKAVIMVGVYKPCAKMIKLAKKNGFRPIFANVSFVGSEALAEALGQDGDGVVVTQVVPHYQADLAATRAYLQAMKGEHVNFISLEGYLAARAFGEGLKLAGPNASAEDFLTALESGLPIDLGLGKPAVLGKAEHQFSHTVWPTYILAGKFHAMKNWAELKREVAAH